jgi:hypothetical protein
MMQSAAAAELPVRKVILYKHGIGYFERSGEIPAGESARLDFKGSDMNDVLKSLTVVDQTGNSVAGVRYDSSMPLNAKLAEFPFRLGEKATVADFLDQLKGARLELKLGQGSVAGQIVGARVAPSRERAQTTTELVSLLTDQGEIVTHDLSAATSIRLTDGALQLQLAEYLRSLNASRSREQKSVYIDSTRDAARNLGVAYAIPMPVWKSSYRLVLDAGAAKKPMLEGWAIIDNTTNEDWTRVDLSVISGRPVSFISKLYEPKYVQRQVAELEEDTPLAPTVYRAGVAPAAPAARDMAGLAAGVGGGSAGGVPGGRLQSKAPMESNRAEISAMAEASTLAVSTQTREAGELFEYRFAQPVTVKRNESAMLPFVQQEVNARKLLIYTSGSRRENPLNSVELTNSTGKTLDGGPLSVYDGGVYAGEALVNTFKADDKRLLSYASDLGTRVVEDQQEGETVRRTLKATNGIVNLTMTSEVTTNYRITNVDRKVKTLMIEHPLRPEHKLLNVKPSEQTATHHRFEVKLTGEASQVFTVKEERQLLETHQLIEFGDEDIQLWLSTNRISSEARQTLTALSNLRRQIAASNNLIRQANQQITELAKDQDRVRQNLNTLRNVSGQQERVQRYATELAEIDSKIVGLRDQIAAETKKRDGLNDELARRVAEANF